jgi:hypothetical protein
MKQCSQIYIQFSNFGPHQMHWVKKTGRDRFEINIFLSGALFVFNSAREEEKSVVFGKTDSIKTIFKEFSRGYKPTAFSFDICLC